MSGVGLHFFSHNAMNDLQRGWCLDPKSTREILSVSIPQHGDYSGPAVDCRLKKTIGCCEMLTNTTFYAIGAPFVFTVSLIGSFACCFLACAGKAASSFDYEEHINSPDPSISSNARRIGRAELDRRREDLSATSDSAANIGCTTLMWNQEFYNSMKPCGLTTLEKTYRLTKEEFAIFKAHAEQNGQIFSS